MVGFAAMGCQSAAKKGVSSESKLDSKLSQSGLPDAQPGAGPGEPQKGFDQQTLGAQG